MDKCPICGYNEWVGVLQPLSLPVFCNVLHATRGAAEQHPRGSFELVACPGCQHLFNSRFEPELLSYGEAYDNNLHFSPTFQKYAERLAAYLYDEYQLDNHLVLEIGCGKGDFLKLLCAQGNVKGIGFDKSYQTDSRLASDQIKIIPEFFSDEYDHLNPYFLICRHVLEHMEQPLQFMINILQISGESLEGFYLEVPNALYTLDDLGIWDLIYEHAGYFTPSSLGLLTEKLGWRVHQIRKNFGGQYLSVEARRNINLTVEDYRLNQAKFNNDIKIFKEEFDRKIESWRHALEKWHKKNKKVMVWGAGSKGVTFLNLLDPEAEFVESLVDIHPGKQGKYIPGTGHRIHSMEHAVSQEMDVVIIMNPNYKSEIERMLYAEKQEVLLLTEQHTHAALEM